MVREPGGDIEHKPREDYVKDGGNEPGGGANIILPGLISGEESEGCSTNARFFSACVTFPGSAEAEGGLGTKIMRRLLPISRTPMTS
jgi:hypothetical protein